MTTKKIQVLKSKVHMVKVTDANLNYEGSLTLDKDIMEAAGIHNYELLHVNCKNNGARLQIYVIPGERGSGIVAINGAATKLIHKGMTVHLLSFCTIDVKDSNAHLPIEIFTENNKLPQIVNHS